MYCRECGQSIPDDSVFCPECGRPAGGPPSQVATPAPPPGTVPNYLVQAIIATVFCCLPAGIVGIINASQASSKEAAGDHAGALLAAKRAKQWCWIAVVGGIIAIAAYAVFMAAAGNGASDF